MALCEGQLDTAMPHVNNENQLNEDDEAKRNGSDGEGSSGQQSANSYSNSHAEGEGQDVEIETVPPALPLSVDYRNPLSHFIPPAVEMYAHTSRPDVASTGSSESPTPLKRKRGRPRIDKTSPEYLAKSAARKHAKEIAATVMNNSGEGSGGEKRKRGRPRIDKTSPEYLARKRAKELEALARKAKRQSKRRNSAAAAMLPPPKNQLPTRLKRVPIPTHKTKLLRKPTLKTSNTVSRSDRKAMIRRKNLKLKKKRDSNASSSTSEMPREKRKYTKRPGSKIGRPRKDASSSGPPVERVKGKRGRPRKVDLNASGISIGMGNHSTPRKPMEGKIRVRSNLMPMNSEPISLDSDDEPDLGSPGEQSISFDENLRALRHIHEKYANLDQDDVYNAQLVAANCRQHDIVDLSEDDHTTVKDRVEKLEDSSNSDSDSSSSESGSSSSSSSSSSSTSSSDSDSDSDDGVKKNGNAAGGPLTANNSHNNYKNDDDGSYGAWSNKTRSHSDSDSITSRASDRDEVLSNASMSASDNESPDKSFQCHICRRWYSTQVTLKIHRRSHQARSSQAGAGGGGSRHSRSRARYSCDQCADTFTRREKLWDHRAEAHRGSMTVRCTVCRKCFEDERDLQTHMNSHSPNERAGRCSECAAVFPRHEALRRHRASAHAHTHTCPTCGKTFTHAHSLTRHVQNHARQLYRCVVCKASFARADQLALHLNSHLANYKRLKP